MTLPVQIMEWKPMNRNTLRGFAKVRIGKALIVNDVAVHNKDGKMWASFPSKPILDKDGIAKRRDDKVQYVPMLEWTDRDTSQRFSQSVVAAVESEYPEDLA